MSWRSRETTEADIKPLLLRFCKPEFGRGVDPEADYLQVYY